jgi:predicted transcriptional regulator
MQSNLKTFGVRPTSRQAFSDLVGELGRRQHLVLMAIYRIQPCTDREIAVELGVTDPNFVRPRRNELMNRGVIKEFDKKVCNISKKTVMSWVVTE